MKEFWKNEWDLFKIDVDNFVKFWAQPVTFSSNKALNPTYEEISEKSDKGGFWKDQWDQFTKEYDSALDYLTKPISFK